MFRINDPKKARIITITVQDNKVKAWIATHEKYKDGTFVRSTWNATFGAEAALTAANLKPKDQILIKSASITNHDYVNKEGKQGTYLAVRIWDFEPVVRETTPAEKIAKTDWTDTPF